MAVTHIPINVSSPKGHQLRLGLDYLEQAIVILRDVTASMPGMVDGGNYSHLETQYGLPTGKGETAKAELETLMAKIDTDNAVSNVKATLQQVFNYFA